MKFIFRLLLLLISSYAFAQKEASWTCDWVYHHTMSLESGTPDARKFEAELNANDLLHNPRYLFAIAEKSSGHYKVFTDGLKIWDTAGIIVPDGVIKNRNSPDPLDYTTIIPLEEYDQQRYYVISRFIENFSTGPDGTSLLFDYKLAYSVIDVDSNTAIKVKNKNIEIISGQDIRYDNMSAAVCGTIKHTDNIGTWLIMKHSLSDCYYIYLVNACGIELKHVYSVKDLVPNYSELQEKHLSCMELYYNGYLMDVRKRGADKLNYFFKFNQTTGELSYYKHFNFKEKYSNWFDGYERYWMYLTDSLYFYTGGMTANEDLVFFQFDLQSAPSGDIDPFYSYLQPKQDIEILQSLPEARIRDTRIYPYTQGRVFLCAAILYSGGNSGTRAQIFAEFKFPQKKCPDCELGPFVLQLDDNPEKPNFAQNSRWYTYWLHNRTHFSPNWKAPEMGVPEVKLSKNCIDEQVTVYLPDSLRGDSLLVFSSVDSVTFNGDENKLLNGSETIIFATPGNYNLTLLRFINCVVDTVMQSITIDEAPHAPAEITDKDTIYSCKQSEIGIRLKEEERFSYTWSDGQTGPYAVFNTDGTYTVTSSNDCGSSTDSVTVVFPEYFIPNLITPNKDQRNDFLTVEPRLHERGKLEIFNRWGDRIFKTDSYGHDWPQMDLKEGVYYYVYRSNRGGCENKGWLQVVK